jgi:hypothetical protein
VIQTNKKIAVPMEEHLCEQHQIGHPSDFYPIELLLDLMQQKNVKAKQAGKLG